MNRRDLYFKVEDQDPEYYLIREAFHNPCNLPSENAMGFASITNPMETAIRMTFNRTIINTYCAGSKFEHSSFRDCVIGHTISGAQTVFYNCRFENCVIILNGMSHAHSVYYFCTFVNCFFACVENGKPCTYDLFARPAFVDGMSINDHIDLGLYFSPDTLPAPPAEFYAWKKVLLYQGELLIGHAVLKLRVPNNASRIRGIGETAKIRVNCAKVLEAYLIAEGYSVQDGHTYTLGNQLSTDDLEGHSLRSYYTRSFEYTLGEWIRPDSFDVTSINFTCTNGIHCFLKQEDALYYNF